MITGDEVKRVLAELLVKTIDNADALQQLMDIIQNEGASSYEVGRGEGERRGYERGYEEGRHDAMRNVDNNIIDYSSMSFYDKERLRRIVRTGSPY